MPNEIDITRLVSAIEPRDYAASVAEFGPDAGRITWEAACDDALDLFGLHFDRETFDAFFAGFGAWSEDELAAHTDAESAALMLQFIAGDIREAPDTFAPFSAEWWQQYEEAAEQGKVSGRIGRGIDGRVYYYIGL